MSDENMSLPGRFAVYGTVAGKPAVVARFEDNDVWLTQKQLADLFNTTKQNINQHTMAIYDSGELDRNRTVKKYLTVQTEGARSIGRHIDHYNLDMIIALGYRIDSPIAIRFRQWATVRLHELIQKGFALEDERLKEGGAQGGGTEACYTVPIRRWLPPHFAKSGGRSCRPWRGFFVVVRADGI